MYTHKTITNTEALPITYSLCAKGADSSTYYGDVARFTNEVLQLASKSIDPLLDRWSEWIAEEEREAPRDYREYLFDALTLGVLWRIHGAKAQKVPAMVCCLLVKLYNLRRAHPSLKHRVDPLRGVLAGHFLVSTRELPPVDGVPCLFRLRKLLLYLEATGEYREEVKRLHLLVDFLGDCDAVEREWHLENLLAFSATVVDLSMRRLGAYTAEVERWLRVSAPEHRWREDALLVARKREEYHLGMLGAELMNRSFASEYRATSARAVLLPACMRGAHAATCKARKVDLDMLCTGCSATCNVNRMRERCAAEGASVHIIPHSSDFTRWLRDWAKGRDLGVVGVACVLHLITGGLELRAEGIPAQCVLLDGCGCSGHWDPAGRETTLNAETLRDVLRS